MDDTIELVSVDDLGVDGDNRGLLAVKLVGLGKSLPGLGLSTSRGSHSEDTMSNFKKLTKLDNFQNELRIIIEFSIPDTLFN